jgi:hypothetical protein
MLNSFFRKSCHLRDNALKYGTAEQATDNDIVRRMRFVCWINNAIDMHPEYVTITVFFPRLQGRNVKVYTYNICLGFFKTMRSA